MSVHDPLELAAPSGAYHIRLRARIIEAVLGRVSCGSIVIRLPSGEHVEHHAGDAGPDAVIMLHDWRALRRIAAAGDLGFAESFIQGEWTSPNLAETIEFFARNADAHASRSRLSQAASRIWHFANGNTRRGSRKNIQFHYDLGNDFYRLWLDRGMQYSSALYGPGDDLAAAQHRKLERIAELLDLRGGENVLEIGCGWGALAEHLVVGRGCRVTGLTLSDEQLAFARDRLSDVSERTDLRLQDYRDAGGQFDRVVSVEMIEAVGEKYWRPYFSVLRDRLNPGGSAVIQAITIREDKFAKYRRNPDFIQRHIFPGGMLPTVSAIHQQAEAAGLTIAHSDAFGASYAETLAEWRRKFHAARSEIAALGFDDRFMRMWDYYLAYCEGGFRAGVIDVGLFVLKRG